MTRIFLINNSLTMSNITYEEVESLEQKREKRILSIEGEEEARSLGQNSVLEHVRKIYTSQYVMSMSTAKYLASNLEQDITVTKSLGERVVGNLGDKKLRTLNELQENDFDYKLSGGESLNDTKKRLKRFIESILVKDKDKDVAMFTHNVAITCLLSIWCEKGFNLDNRLILNYHDEAIVDGAWDGITIIELDFDNQKLEDIKRIK